MTEKDGSVIGVTQIAGNRRPNRAINVVLIGDGYTAGEQTSFDAAAATITSKILSTKPFDQVASIFNVFRINVASTESGADYPRKGLKVRTFFDATFGIEGLDRMMTCDFARAALVAAKYVPDYTTVLVVANSTELLGGSAGGDVAVISALPSALTVALHELGHSLFGLADEYEYLFGGSEPYRSHHPDYEPVQPNVTTNTDRATLKWSTSVKPSTPLPTMPIVDCDHPKSGPSPVPAGTVGLFEGANTYRCGVYRPEFTCRMRDNFGEFCFVCQQVILRRLLPMFLGTELIFYNNDSGQLQTATMDGAGRLAFQEPGSFGPGVTHIATLDSELLIYEARTGTSRTGTIDDNGHFTQQRSFDLSAGWTHLVTVGPIVLFYNRDTGQAQTGTINSDGDFVGLKPHEFSAGWSHVVAMDRRVLFYNQDTGQTQQGDFYAAGRYSNERPGELSTGWTHVVAVGAELLFYRSSTGEIATVRFPAKGPLVGQQVGKLPTNLSQIVPVVSRNGPILQQGKLLLYDGSTGDVMVGFVDDAGHYTKLPVPKQFNLKLSKGWTTIATRA